MSKDNGNKPNPFQSEGIEYEISGNKVALKPITIGSLHEIIEIGNNAIADFANLSEKTGIGDIASIVSKKHCEIMRVLFPDPPYAFMTADFIKKNMTVIMARHIIEEAKNQNGLADIWPFLKKMTSSGALTSTSKIGG